MPRYGPLKDVHLTLTNMYTRISTSLTAPTTFSSEDITKYLNITLNQNKRYVLSSYSIPFVNDIGYMLCELNVSEEEEFVIEYEEIENYEERFEINDRIEVLEVKKDILYGNENGLYRIDGSQDSNGCTSVDGCVGVDVCMIYSGCVNDIASEDKTREVYITNDKNEIIKIFTSAAAGPNGQGGASVATDASAQSVKSAQSIKSAQSGASIIDYTTMPSIGGNSSTNTESKKTENSESLFFTRVNYKVELQKFEVIKKSTEVEKNTEAKKNEEEKIGKIYAFENDLYYSTIIGNIYKFENEKDILIAQNILEVTKMQVYNNFLFVSSLSNSFLSINLNDLTINYILKNFSVTSFIFYNNEILLAGTTGIAKIIQNIDKTVLKQSGDNFEVYNNENQVELINEEVKNFTDYKVTNFNLNIRFTENVCDWNDLIIFGGGSGIFVTQNQKLKSKILIENEFKGIGILKNTLIVATKNTLQGFTLQK